MATRYEAAIAPHNLGGLGWYVRQFDSHGCTAWIKCYCYGEAAAKEIADALNCVAAATVVADAIKNRQPPKEGS